MQELVARRYILHLVRRGQAQRLAQVAVQQVHVGAQRERRRVMPQPALHLHGVAPLVEQ
jgi:hypothetical protein